MKVISEKKISHNLKSISYSQNHTWKPPSFYFSSTTASQSLKLVFVLDTMSAPHSNARCLIILQHRKPILCYLLQLSITSTSFCNCSLTRQLQRTQKEKGTFCCNLSSYGSTLNLGAIQSFPNTYAWKQSEESCTVPYIIS